MLEVFMSALAYILALMVGFWCWFQWWSWDFLQAARRLPNSGRIYPFLGHLRLFQSWEDITMTILEFSSTVVSTGIYNACFWCGPIPLVAIHKPEDVQKLLTTSCTAEKADETVYLKYAVGNALITAPGKIWKLTRRHINPLFQSRNVEQLMTTFNINSRELVRDLAEHAGGRPVNTLHPVMNVALKTVCQLSFGTQLDFDNKSELFAAMIQSIENVPAFFIQRVVKPWLRIDFIFEFLYRKELNEIARVTKQFTEAPLKISKSHHANKHSNDTSKSSDHCDLTHEGTLTLIDVYAQLQKKYPQFKENDLEYELASLYGTGTDTIGVTVSTCLLVLSKYPNLQERVYEEINSVVGLSDDVTIDHIGRMKYLDQVFNETLRWGIIVPYIIRKTAKELKLSTCTIPAGNTVVACLAGPLMDPSIYPHPHRFDPERFSPENVSSRSKHSFTPFSSGKRMCIAKTYSENLVKTMLVHVLRRFRISTDMDIHNLKKVLVITLVNSEGYNIKFQNRK